tara:strand:- start:346 stop:654 length:309 start_codon:yes stop_codon:yes gene_type:complete
MTTEMAEPKLKTKDQQLELRRKRNWFARFSITIIVVTTFLILVGLLFFSDVPQEARDLLNILVGAYVAVLAKTTDYWFKEKEDPEIAEGERLHEAENGNGLG